ncbi:MAG TPA: hypothetical protein VNA20_01850 [Frankiaceae bacterium]|nr:hypothetical protein [Frankiaceae bacterium]
MDRSALVRRGAPIAVFAGVLAGLTALAVRPGGDPAPKPLEPLPIALGARSGGEGRGAPAASTADMMYVAGRIVIPDRLLQGVPTEGPVHDVTRGDVSDERLLRLARALGVVGVVRPDDEGWVVGTGDRVLRVYKQPGTPWYLGPDKGVAVARPIAEPVTPKPAPDEPADQPADQPASDQPADTPVQSDPMPPATASDSPCEKDCTTPGCPPPAPGTEPACEPVPEPTKPPQPSDEEARAAAQRVFDAAGLTDPATTINDAWSGKEVVGAPLVGGLPTSGFETRVTVELGGRIQYANGHLGGTELKGDYPLLAPRDAADRSGPYGQPRAMHDMACPETDGGSPQPCPTPAPREAQKLRLGLVLFHSYDQAQGAFLAPAWFLTFEGSAWEEPVLALPDRYLATPPPPSDGAVPPDEPVSDDGGSSSGGGSAGSTGAPETTK